MPYGAATGTTDGGFGGFNRMVSDVLLHADGTLNYDALFAFGYKAIHEMSVLGKELTRKFYQSNKFYSYYSGCSEGGREGFSQVQRYGSQFDGAAIGAPAFRQAFQQVFHLFSGVVEKTRDYYPSPCELEKINNDTIAFCDALDGKADGVISRTDLCKLLYKPQASVGKQYQCPATAGGGSPGGSSSSPTPAQNGTVTSQAADVANDINKGLFDSKGRQVYFSFQPGSGYPDAATTYNATTGKFEASASGIGVQYVNLFLKEINSSALSLDGVTYDTLRTWILEGIQKFQDTLQTTWPDLEDFQSSGAKLIHYHGESDNSIPAASSVLYHDSVRKVMYPDSGVLDGYSKLNDWYRLFLVPGAGHCGPSTNQPGPFPQDVVASLIDWVENGNNPKMLNATVQTTGQQQQICTWPLRPLWVGNTQTCVYDQLSFDSWLPDLNSIPLPVY
jgi:tannase